MATVTAEELERAIVDAIAELGAEPERITREATLEALDIDSLDLVEIAQILEDEYSVVIRPEDGKRIRTVGDAIHLAVSRAS